MNGYIVEIHDITDPQLARIKADLVRQEHAIRMGKLANIINLINEITLEQERRKHANS